MSERGLRGTRGTQRQAFSGGKDGNVMPSPHPLDLLRVRWKAAQLQGC